MQTDFILTDKLLKRIRYRYLVYGRSNRFSRNEIVLTPVEVQTRLIALKIENRYKIKKIHSDVATYQKKLPLK